MKTLNLKKQEYIKPNKKWLNEITLIGKFTKKVNTNTRNVLTEYQNQFKTKQIIKEYYGNISENYLNNLVKKNKLPLIILLEKRLDVVLFRLGFARSIYEARILIKHGHISINYKPITYVNYLLNIGSIVTTNSLTSYLSKIEHIKSNKFKEPTHLISIVKKNPLLLKGIYLNDALEKDIILPLDITIDKFNSYFNK